MAFRYTLCQRRLSTVHRGVAFEERALNLLKDNFSMSLKRVGGRGDGGIDLLGWWWLPHQPPPSSALSSSSSSQPLPRPKIAGLTRRRIRVVGQCKAEKKKLGPNYVRELEGVMYRLATESSSGLATPTPLAHSPEESKDDEAAAMAILVSQSAFTKATLLRAQSSPIPFLLLHLPPALPASTPLLLSSSEAPSPSDSREDGTVASAVWNMALGGTQGLLRGEMEVRWEWEVSSRRSSSLSGSPVDASPSSAPSSFSSTTSTSSTGKPTLWYKGTKVSSCIPDGF